MTYKYIIIILLVALAHQKTYAQKGEYELKYRGAIELIQKENYGKAQAELLPMTNKKYDYPQTPYCLYFFSLACLKNGQSMDTKLMLKQLLDRYPNFEKKDDVYFLMANAYFMTDDFVAAIETLRKIGADNLKVDIDKMEENYFSKISKIEVLRNLYAAYPDDKIIALNYADLLMRTSTERSDLELSDRISNRYGVKTKQIEASGSSFVNMVNAKRKENPNKGYLNVGVLFPFGVNDLDPDKKTRQNQYVLDMYEGIKIAKSALQKEGIVINLYAFDVDNKTEPLIELLQNNQFNQMDMYIGPLHNETNRIVANYCNQNKVPLINPLASNKELLNNQPYVYLARPSLEMKAAKVAIFAQNNLMSSSKSIAIFYSANKSDSTFAFTYANYVQNLGLEVNTLAKLPSGSVDNISSVMPDGKSIKLNHVFLASSNKNVGANFLSALERKKINAPSIITAEALNTDNAGANFFEDKNLYIIDLEFKDKNKEEFNHFQNTYLNKRMTLPSEYAMQGYDLMLFFGKMLGKYGIRFSQNISKKSYTEGYVLGGYDYTESNENQVVTIVKYENYKLTPTKN